MGIGLLWADDDCEEFLAPLGTVLRRNGFDPLITATNYEDAVQKLLVEGARIQSALLDIILPHASGTYGALAPDLGLALAEQIASAGVQSVAFLTVTRHDEVLDEYRKLMARHPAVRFKYFDKTRLLERSTLMGMMEFLQGPEKPGSAA